jgi:DNA replication protein DnaC
MDEAMHQLQSGRAMTRWARYDLVALDEVGYVPLAEVGAEFLFQVIAERAERAAVIVTTNLPFAEWTQVIPNARRCKALIDRITDRANIIEPAESYRFQDPNRVLALPSHSGEGQGQKPGHQEHTRRRRPAPAETKNL